MTSAEEADIRALHDRVSSFCGQAGYRLSPQADAVVMDMVKMKALLGDFYCPCQTQKSHETVCVCEPVRKGLVDMMGACYCGLILSRE